MSSYIKGGNAISSQSSTAHATATSALVHEPHRKSFTIQNMGTNPIYVFLSSSTPTSSSNHYIIPGGTAAEDGKGGVLPVDGYKGPVTLAGTGLIYSVVEYI